MPSTARQTKYAANQDRNICMLLDVRGNARDLTLQVWSPGEGKIVNLPRFEFGTRTPRITNHTPDHQRWCAITVPAWYRKRYGLYGYNLPPVMSGFCRLHAPDHRTVEMVREDAERDISEYIISQQNRYRRLPGQRLSSHKADRFNGNIFA
jgi:hypothetical protein